MTPPLSGCRTMPPTPQLHNALRYGAPIVATGGKDDKPEVGARVAWSADQE
jgi:hypothetical protein